MTAADVLVESLLDWGNRRSFQLPGDSINGIMEALRAREEEGEYVHGVRRTRNSRATVRTVSLRPPGRIRLSQWTSTPNWTTNLSWQSPDFANSTIGTYTQQDVALDKAVHRRRSFYNERIMGPTHVKMLPTLPVVQLYRGV